MVWVPISKDGECVIDSVKKHGVQYEEISCLYPQLRYIMMEWEHWFRPFRLWDFLASNDWIPILAVTLYFFAIFGGRKYFEKRPAWNFRNTLAAWNLLLSVFSFIGVLRMFPQLIHNMIHYSLRDNLCESAFSLLGEGSAGLWCAFFVLSKFAELFDTAFIVVHKKPLLFLHWYHHITVLLNCWHTWRMETPTGLIFCAVNFAVHTIMYFYYFLMAVKLKPKWYNPVVITIAQIVQMVVGVGVCIRAWMYLRVDDTCKADRSNIVLTLGMYASYLTLFLKFFFDRYVFKASSLKGKKMKIF